MNARAVMTATTAWITLIFTASLLLGVPGVATAANEWVQWEEVAVYSPTVTKTEWTVVDSHFTLTECKAEALMRSQAQQQGTSRPGWVVSRADSVVMAKWEAGEVTVFFARLCFPVSLDPRKSS